jgi:hypothetical protein
VQVEYLTFKISLKDAKILELEQKLTLLENGKAALEGEINKLHSQIVDIQAVNGYLNTTRIAIIGYIYIYIIFLYIYIY